MSNVPASSGSTLEGWVEVRRPAPTTAKNLLPIPPISLTEEEELFWYRTSSSVTPEDDGANVKSLLGDFTEHSARLMRALSRLEEQGFKEFRFDDPTAKMLPFLMVTQSSTCYNNGRISQAENEDMLSLIDRMHSKLAQSTCYNNTFYDSWSKIFNFQEKSDTTLP